MKIVTIGGAMLDSIAIVENDRIERMAMRNADTSFLLIEEGRKTEASEISNHCGGGAVNAAVAMARLGCDVSTVVKLGRDQRADTILSRLEREGVSTRWVMRDLREPTGASVLVSSHERDAAIFTFRGANALLEPDDLKDGAFAVDLAYISSLSNQSADCFPHLIQKAKANKALVATNPGIRQLSVRAGAFHEVLQDIDILSINRIEADALVPQLVSRFGEGGPSLPLEPGEKPPSLVARGLSSGGFDMSLIRFFCALLELGPRYIVITDGRQGALVGSADGIHFCPASSETVVGTAGAGDAFASTFATFIGLGQSVEQSMLAAIVNAASVINFVDTQSGLLTRDVLLKRIQDIKKVLSVRNWQI